MALPLMSETAVSGSTSAVPLAYRNKNHLCPGNRVPYAIGNLHHQRMAGGFPYGYRLSIARDIVAQRIHRLAYTIIRPPQRKCPD